MLTTLVPEPNLPPPRSPPVLWEAVKCHTSPSTQQVIHDQITGIVSVVSCVTETLVLEDGLGTLAGELSFRCSASSNDPSQASIVGRNHYMLEREDGTIKVTSETTIRATRTDFPYPDRPARQPEWIAVLPSAVDGL